MEKINFLKSKIREYLRLRKVFRNGEVIVSLIVILLLFAFGETFGNIVACVLGVLLIPEAFLVVRRSDIKLLIRD